MRLRHLEVFNAIMDVGSITGAGAALGVSQSSISKVLQHFELQTGLHLFERKAGKLSPTPEARRLYADSEKLISHLKTVRRVAAAFPGQGRSVVRVVATPSIASALLPGAIPAWRAASPGGRCEISTFHTADMVTRLLLGEADFGLTLQNPCKEGVTAVLLAEDHMLAVAAPGTWSAAECSTALPVAGLGERMIGIAVTDPLGALVHAVMESHDCQSSCMTVAQTHQLAGALAAAGHGVALIDPFTARAMAVQTRQTVPPIPVHLWLLAREDVHLQPHALQLVDAVRAAAAARIPSGYGAGQPFHVAGFGQAT